MRNVMENQLSWFAILMTAFYSLLSTCRGEECGPEVLQGCAKPLQQIANTPTDYVKSKEDLDRLCPDLEAGTACIKRYTQRCMNDRQREHFTQLYSGTNMAVMELCQDELYQERFLIHAPCMQKVEKEFDNCSTNYTITMHDITTGKQPNQVKSICCSFQEYINCSHNAVLKTCGNEAAKFAKEFLDRMSNSLIKMHCQAYSEDTCKPSKASSENNKNGSSSQFTTTGSFFIVAPLLLFTTASRYFF